MLCEYGCGQEAKYQFKNGKWCCEKFTTKCPVNRQKNSKGLLNNVNIRKSRPYLKGDKNGMFGKTKELNPFYRKTHTKKQKAKWKKDRNNIDYKKNMSNLMKKLWKEEWFYNSHITYTNKELGRKKSYYRSVWRYTRQSLNKFYKIINPNNLELTYETYHPDHKFSIIEGFKQNVDPKIIGNFVNLQILRKLENIKKGSKCSISLETLMEEYENNI